MIFVRNCEESVLCILAGMQLCLAVSLVKTFHTPQRNNHQNISTLLDNLLRGYDNSIRPDFGGKLYIIKYDL